MKKINFILFLVYFSFIGFGCTPKTTQQNTHAKSSETKISESSSNIKEYLEIDYDDQSTFTFKNISDKKIQIDISDITISQQINNDWISIDGVKTKLFMTELVEPSMTIDYTSPEPLEKDVNYQMTIPFSLNSSADEKIEQVYFFKIN
jgi:hypothetical protein